MQKWILLAAALIGVAQAQTAPPVAFEVASVKIAAPCCAPGQWRESKILDDRIDFRYVTMRYCLAAAFGVKEYQVSGPPWITEARYDIVAKAAEGTRREQIPAMLRALLVERFKLEVHQEKKEFDVFALIVGKNGPKMTETPANTETQGGASYGISMSATGVGRVECRRATMTSLAATLPRFVGRPVVDLTGLTGRYDFDLEFSPDDTKEMRMALPNESVPAAEFGMSIFTSIQKAGLRLDPRKMPLDTVVVDRGEKTPAEN